MRGVSPSFLSLIAGAIQAFHDCLRSDRIMEALNILRYMDALAFPGDKESLCAEYDQKILPGVMSIEATALNQDGYPEQLKMEAIRREKALLLQHLESIMLALHARDAFIHETYYIEGGVPA